MKRISVFLPVIVLFVILLGGSLEATRADTVIPSSASTTNFLAGSIDYVRDGFPRSYQSLYVGVGSGGWDGPYTISFTLPSSGTWDLTGMNLWNNGGVTGGDGDGINEFTLNFWNSSSSSAGSYNGIAEDTVAQQFFDFTPLSFNSVVSVDLIINSNHSTTKGYAQFTEINFIGTDPPGVVDTNGGPTGTPNGLPEPATMLLLGSGLIGLLGLRRRFKK